MDITVRPSFLKGSITAPPSKSMTQRAIAASLLAKGTTTIVNPSNCEDSVAALGMIRKLGAEVVGGTGDLVVNGGFLLHGTRLHCGESGLAMRMFAPIAALRKEEITFTGEGSLTRRPVAMISEALGQLGVEVKTNNGLLPFTVKGPLKGGSAAIDGSVSSQLLTGLLMALPLAEGDSEIRVNNLKSKPYIEMTLQLLNAFGIVVENDKLETFRIKGGQAYKPIEFPVEGDWSGGAFLLVAGVLNGEITVKGLEKGSFQSDKAVLEALKMAGAVLTQSENEIRIAKSSLKAFHFDATECPDLFPPLAVLAAGCSGTSTLSGVGRLTHKESNRATAISEEFSKLGVSVTIDGDTMHITGGKINGAFVNSHHDHRIAMMEATAALIASGPITIAGAESVAKSYPAFFSHLKKLGAEISEI